MSDQSSNGPPARETGPSREVTIGGDADAEPTIGVLDMPVSVYEWGGAIVAGLGFFMTPLLTALPAGYCALKVRPYNRLATLGILTLVAASAVFWSLFYLADDLMRVGTQIAVGLATPAFLLAVPILVVLAGLLGVAYLLFAR